MAVSPRAKKKSTDNLNVFYTPPKPRTWSMIWRTPRRQRRLFLGLSDSPLLADHGNWLRRGMPGTDLQKPPARFMQRSIGTIPTATNSRAERAREVALARPAVELQRFLRS